MPETVPLPACLAAWIDTNMTELGGVQTVRFVPCDRVPFEWLPGFLPNVRGLTLWNDVYLKRDCLPIDVDDEDAVELALHELVHVAQFRRNWLGFPLLYLCHFVRFGYWNIPAEAEARGRAGQLLRQYQKDRPCTP